MKHTNPSWQWLSAIETIAIEGGYAGRTGPVETLLIVLGGTFDMVAGGGQWPARGVRSSPLRGKPVTLFLPPNTGFELQNGSGEILLVSGVQPAREEAVGEATSKRPLLALAGSGKAFDPATGEWKNQEMFPSSPQALLPRHIEQTDGEGHIIRHVFPWHFKALCLSLDEMVIEAGTSAAMPKAEIPGYPLERALYYDAPGGLLVDGVPCTGLGCAEVTPDSQFTAQSAAAFLALAYAGPKP